MAIDPHSILDQLDEHLAVIDEAGIIQYTNNTWVAFGQANGIRKDFNWIGVNYLRNCSENHEVDGDIAQQATSGICSVIDATADQFQLNYPCHSPFEKRWFLMKVTPLNTRQNGLFLIRHINTTEQTVAKKLSQEDPLTGLYNRRYLERFLDREWRRCLRHRSNLTLIFLDLDNFKHINDYLGHSAGDRSLIRFAQLLHEYTRRPGDVAVRLGGDEFALVLADSTYAEANATADAILSTLKRMALPATDNTVVTTSIGLVNGVPGPEHEIKDWWEIADSLLYKSKSNGGNKVYGVSLTSPNSIK